MNNLNNEKKYPDGYPPTYVHSIPNYNTTTHYAQQYPPNISVVPNFIQNQVPPSYTTTNPTVYSQVASSQNMNSNNMGYTPTINNQNITLPPSYTTTLHNQNISLPSSYTTTNPIVYPQVASPQVTNSNCSLYPSTNPTTYSSNSPIYTINNPLPNTYIPYAPNTMIYNPYYVPTTTTTIYQLPMQTSPCNYTTTITYTSIPNDKVISTVIPSHDTSLLNSLNNHIIQENIQKNIQKNIKTATTTTTIYNCE